MLESSTQSPQLQEVPLEVAQKLPHQLEQLQRNSQQLIELGNVKDPTLIKQLLPVADVSSQDSPASLTAEALARTGRSAACGPVPYPSLPASQDAAPTCWPPCLCACMRQACVAVLAKRQCSHQLLGLAHAQPDACQHWVKDFVGRNARPACLPLAHSMHDLHDHLGLCLQRFQRDDNLRCSLEQSRASSETHSPNMEHRKPFLCCTQPVHKAT